MFLLVFAIVAGLVAAQSCDNYGIPGGSSCSCPVGYGGANCSIPACGGTIFQGSQRPLVQGQGQFGNITSCTCQSGWGGVGCNVCLSADSCQSGYNAVASGQATPNIPLAGQNSTMTCSQSPRVYAAGQMSCSVVNPTLQALYSGKTDLNIMRTIQSRFSPLPNTTSFGTDGSVYAQLLYTGVEQFFCTASSCQQTINEDTKIADWKCSDLKCTCRRDSTFCQAGSTLDLSGILNTLSGNLEISCKFPDSGQSTSSCNFKQDVINSVFGPSGLALSGCGFGECVRQAVIDTASNSTSQEENTAASLSGGVIAGLAVVGVLVLLALSVLFFGFLRQRKARLSPNDRRDYGGVGVEWTGLSYSVTNNSIWRKKRSAAGTSLILDNVSGTIKAGELMAILGPSGAGKTTLVEVLAGKPKTGQVTGEVGFTAADGTPLSRNPRIGYVDQMDVLPAMLTPLEALLFAANLRLPESVQPADKLSRVYNVITQLGLDDVANTRIGSQTRRGISGGEMRRVSIGLELVGEPDVLILDEPTSGLDSVSAMKVITVLKNVAHDPENPRVVICSIHQPSSKIYHVFDRVLLLARGKSIYNGSGGVASSEYFASKGVPCPEGYNVADHLLDVASDPKGFDSDDDQSHNKEMASSSPGHPKHANGSDKPLKPAALPSSYATTFLTQLQVLSGREWKGLTRDKSLFITHFATASILGVFCGGLYFDADVTIAGFQSRVGCLFFLGALISFSSLSALYNLVEIRPLFLRERAAALYSPTAWLISRVIFDVIPLRLIPTIVVGTITYWMAGLAPDAAHFFKFLFILVLYSLGMTLFNFLLACLFRNGGIAILLSALTGLYQMTYAGFFVNLGSIPPVLRWLQWLCPLKYCLEALAVNEVGSGLLITDTLQGVPINVSAVLIMEMLFGFGVNNYYRDVLVLFGFIAGFGMGTILVVWLTVRERR